MKFWIIMWKLYDKSQITTENQGISIILLAEYMLLNLGYVRGVYVAL